MSQQTAQRRCSSDKPGGFPAPSGKDGAFLGPSGDFSPGGKGLGGLVSPPTAGKGAKTEAARDAWRCTNTLHGPATAPGQVIWETSGYHLSQLRARANVMDGEYLFRAFRASGVSEQFQVAANGVTRFGIAARAIGDVLFPVPPLDEQRVIAVFLRRETAGRSA